VLRWFAVLVAALALVGVTPGTASAATIVVRAGESIQAAIDRASPGDTILVRPGTYRENLTIQKDNLTLKASDGRGSVLLRPGKPPSLGGCPWPFYSGICVLGQVDEHGNLGAPVSGTRVVGFTVAHFVGSGIVLLNANDSAVSDTEVHNNFGYGIEGSVLSTVRLANNVAHDNWLAGFYISYSPNANATVVGNRSQRNIVWCPPQLCPEDVGYGFLFRDSSHGVVRDNSAWDNCVGYAFIDSGDDPAPLSDWQATGNLAQHNNQACRAWYPAVRPSWLGFLLLGTDHVLLSGNLVEGNVGRTSQSGGIMLASSAKYGGADPTNNVVRDNVIVKNRPFDIRWDEAGSGNVFRNNLCRRSEPSWICAGF
jgi:hypothetical protein